MSSAARWRLAGIALLLLLVHGAVAWASGTGATSFEQELAARGLLATLGVAFVSGIGAVFSPCVYPLIPITLSVIGARGASGRGSAILNAAIYVLGMAVMYTALGITAAGLGKIAGFSHQNPYLMGFVVLVFGAMAMSMFGVWEMRVQAQWTERLISGRGRYLGIFFMGLVSGIVAAPCTAPFVFNLLAYVAQTRDMALGGGTLFVFSLGLGLPFLVLGYFSGAVARLPKSGPWLMMVKYTFGTAMLGLAVYYLQYVIGGELAAVVGGIVLVLVGVAATRRSVLAWTDKVVRAGGVLVLAAGFVLYGQGLVWANQTLFGPPNPAPVAAGIPWITSETIAAEKARSEKRPMLIDFWANWCKPCKELEKNLLRHPKVVAAARRFVAAKIDCTKEDPAVARLYRKYGVSGLPAVVLVDSTGTPLKKLILNEEIPADDFVARLNRVK